MTLTENCWSARSLLPMGEPLKTKLTWSFACLFREGMVFADMRLDTFYLRRQACIIKRVFGFA